MYKLVVPKIQQAPQGLIKQYSFNRIVRLWKDSVAAFITAVIPVIHINTGMSRASLIGLTDDVNWGQKPSDSPRKVLKSFVLSKLKPVANPSTKWYVSMGGTPQIGIHKSQELGYQDGRRNYTLNFGSKDAPNLVFKFDISVYQWDKWENKWGTLEVGKDAFITYFEKNFVKTINVRKITNYLQTGKSSPLVEAKEALF